MAFVSVWMRLVLLVLCLIAQTYIFVWLVINCIRDYSARRRNKKRQNGTNLAHLNKNLQKEKTSMKKAMISQPMGGKTDEEIKKVREHAAKELEGAGFEVLDTWFKHDGPTNPLHDLALSLDAMSECDIVYFCKGWEEARGCKIEHEAAVAYGLTLIHERRTIH